MTPVALLSNGKFHVLLSSEGTGYSRWNDLAVTRWRDDAVLDAGGTFVYLRDDENRRAISAADARVTIDGMSSADGSITLADDGRTHEVVIDVWREPPSRQSPP